MSICSAGFRLRSMSLRQRCTRACIVCVMAIGVIDSQSRVDARSRDHFIREHRSLSRNIRLRTHRPISALSSLPGPFFSPLSRALSTLLSFDLSPLISPLPAVLFPISPVLFLLSSVGVLISPVIFPTPSPSLPSHLLFFHLIPPLLTLPFPFLSQRSLPLRDLFLSLPLHPSPRL